MKILVLATEWWYLPGNISIALAKAGMQVALISPSRSVVRKINAVQVYFTYRPWDGPDSIGDAVEKWSPDFLIPTDDQAVSDLHRIHELDSAVGGRGDDIRKLIEKSLGDPSSFAFARAKSKLMELAASTGVLCPRTVLIPDESTLERELTNANYPIVVKADGSYGGRGVRIVDNNEAAYDAFRILSMPFPGASAIIQSIDGLTVRPILERLLGRRRTVTLQEHVKGYCANRAVVCLNGDVLQGISVKAVEVVGVTGPSSVIRVIDNVDMSKTAAALVKNLKLSGFIGFDFIIDSSNHAWLVEMNPRVTPASHLAPADGINLISAFYSHTAGVRSIALPRSQRHKVVTYFPQELHRSASSAHLSVGYHDVPWNELDYVRSCLVADSGTSFVTRIRNRFGLNSRTLRRPSKFFRPWDRSLHTDAHQKLAQRPFTIRNRRLWPSEN